MVKPQRRMSKKEMKQDEFLEFMFTAEQFVRRNAKMISYIAVGVIVVVVVGIMMYNNKQQAETQAAAAVGAAQGLYDQGNYQQAIEELQVIIEDYRGTRSAGVGVFYLGSAHNRLGNDEQAAEYFELYLDKYDNDPILAASSLAAIGSYQAENGNFTDASDYFRQASQRVDVRFLSQRYRLEQIRYTFEAGESSEAERMLTALMDADELDPAVQNDAEELFANIQVSLSN